MGAASGISGPFCVYNSLNDPSQVDACSETLLGVACCPYHHLRKGEVDLEMGEQVEILDVSGGYAHVEKGNGEHGKVPSYFLELVDIPGETLAEQISYRRMWHAVVDEVVPSSYPVCPLTEEETIRRDVTMVVLDSRPVFVVPLRDVSVCEGERVVLRPEINCSTPFTVVWRGPAVQAGRAKVETNGNSTVLTIENVVALDYGPYSVVARNDYGLASSLAVVNVITRPDPPASVTCQRVGGNALLLSWSPGFRKGIYFGVEFKSEDMEQFRCAATALRSTTISLRHFRQTRYKIRLFSYNLGFRSRPSKEIEVDFSEEFSLLENLSELPSSMKSGKFCGRGRFSVVHEAAMQNNRRSLVAVKVLHEDVVKADVEREVSVLSTLHHSSMPRLKGVFTSEGRYCIVMKKMPGIAISAYVDEFMQTHDESGQLERQLRRLSIDILSALRYLHTRGIVHLDIKPSNLLVSDHVSIVDFGCARFVDDEVDMEWGDCNKSYSAPERIAGKSPCTGSDIWSFGAVLFELCFGVAPHRMLTTLTTNPEQRSPALLSFLNEESEESVVVMRALEVEVQSLPRTDMRETVLALESSRRPSAEECMQKEWIKEVTPNRLRVPEERRDFRSRSASFEG